MQNNSAFKYLSIGLLVIILPVLLWMATQASISGDEFLHRDQAESVVDYFFTFGADQSALHTPITNLKHYGQGYDNLASLIARIFNIEDIFLLRHLMSAMAGWLIFLVAFLLARKISNYETAFFTILILGVSPGFIGHSLNNLKDIPFALGYITGIYFISNWINQWPRPKLKTAFGLVAAIAFSINIRPPGLILIAILGLAVTIIAINDYREEKLAAKTIVILLATTTLVMLAGYFAGLLFWPFAWQNPLVNPILSHALMEAYPVTIRQLFMGKLIWSDMLPWYYLLWMMIITIPLLLFAALVSFAGLYRFKNSPKTIALLLFSVLFPLIYIIAKESNVYGGWRHILFIYPPLTVLAGYGITLLFKQFKRRFKKAATLIIALLFLLMMAEPVAFMIRNHPFHYLYFNPIVGGYQGAYGKYEADYYFNTIEPAARWLNKYISQNHEKQVKVASNFESKWHFRNNPEVISVSQTGYYNRSHLDWDYGIFSATYFQSGTLKDGIWPPPGTIHTVEVDGKSVCVVIKRISKLEFNGWEAIKANRIEEAEKLLVASVKLDSVSEGAWLDYGRVCYQLGNYDGAIEKLNQSLAIHPSFEPALLEKARCQMKLKKTVEALLLTNQLLDINVKYLPVYMLKADVLINLNKKEEAIATIKKAVAIQPSYNPAIERLLKLKENN
jgi:4-amino-4-deoxy-L-arabinose transferase-like glycosyltransferase/predicted negative regulator of RcsB-dependent stress response